MAGRDNTELRYVSDQLSRTISRSSHYGVPKHYGELSAPELWQTVVPADLWHSVQLLSEHPAMRFAIDKYSRGYISVGGDLLKLSFRKVPLPTAASESHPLIVPEEHPLFQALKTYAREAKEHAAKMVRAQKFVDKYAERANTLGQFARMWPDVVPYLHTATSLSNRNQIRKSRLPRGFEFDQQYLERRQEATDLLALGILVDSKEDILPDVWVP